MTDRPIPGTADRYTHPAEWLQPAREPNPKTVEELETKLVKFEGGDWRASMASALGAGWGAFFNALPAHKIQRLANALYDAATSTRSSTRVRLRSAEVIMKLFLQGTKALADLVTLGGAAPPPSGGNVLQINLDASDALEQLERHAAVLREIQAVEAVGVESEVASVGSVMVSSGDAENELETEPSLEKLAEVAAAEETT